MENHNMMFEDSALRNALGRIRMSDMDENGMEMSALPHNPALAMAYIPMQFYRDTYGIEEGFNAGTVFPELDKPFLGGNCK